MDEARTRRVHKRHSTLNRSLGGDIFINGLLIVFGAFMALPLIYTVSSALKPPDELWVFPPRFLTYNPTLRNFKDMVRLMSGTMVPFTRYIFNTVFVSVIGTAGHVVISSLAAFCFAKYRFPFSRFLFNMVVLALMFNTTVSRSLSAVFVAAMCLSLASGCSKEARYETIYEDEYITQPQNSGGVQGGTTESVGANDPTGNNGADDNNTPADGNATDGKNDRKTTTAHNNPGTVKTTQKAEPPKNDGIDLQGYTLTMAVIDNGAWMYNGQDKGNGYKQFQQVIADTQKKLNCKIEFKTNYQYGTSYNSFSKTIMSGKKPADVMAIHLYEMCQFTSEKMLIAIQDIPGIDLSKNYWNEVVTNSTKIGGKSYGMANDMFSHDLYNNVVFFNKNILEDYKQLENPYDLVKAGTWTYDKMLEMCEVVKDPSKGQYGLAIHNHDLCVTLPMGGGVPDSRDKRRKSQLCVQQQQRGRRNQ